MAFKIEDRMGVQAPAEVIWAVIADLARWPQWNPVYPRAEGVLAFGAKLDMDLQLPGRPPMRLRPVVADWVPNDQLHMNLSFAGGLVKSTRYIEIERLTPTGCILSNGELFKGVGLSLIDHATRRAIATAFAEMTAALKARAERDWTAMGPDAQAAHLAAAPPIPPPPPPLPKIRVAKPIGIKFLKR